MLRYTSLLFLTCICVSLPYVCSYANSTEQANALAKFSNPPPNAIQSNNNNLTKKFKLRASNNLDWLDVDLKVLENNTSSIILTPGFYHYQDEFGKRTVSYIEGNYTRLWGGWKQDNITIYDSFIKCGIRVEENNLLRISGLYGYITDNSETSFSAKYLRKTLHFDESLQENIKEYGLGLRKSYFLNIPVLKALNIEANYFKNPYKDNSFRVDENTRMLVSGYSNWDINIGSNFSYFLTNEMNIKGAIYGGYGNTKFSYSEDTDLIYGAELELETNFGNLSGSYVHNPTINKIRYAYSLIGNHWDLSLYNEILEKIAVNYREEKQGIEVGITLLTLSDFLKENFFKLNKISCEENTSSREYVHPSQVNYPHEFASNELSVNPIQIIQSPQACEIDFVPLSSVQNDPFCLKGEELVVELSGEVQAIYNCNIFPHVSLESNKVKFNLQKISSGAIFCVVGGDEEYTRIEFDIEIKDGVKRVLNFKKAKTEEVEYASSKAEIALKVKNFRLNPEYDSGRNKTDNKTNLETLGFSWDSVGKADHFLIEILEGSRLCKSKTINAKDLEPTRPFCLVSMPSKDGKYTVSIFPFKGDKRGESTSLEVEYYKIFELDLANKIFKDAGFHKEGFSGYLEKYYDVIIPVVSKNSSLDLYNLNNLTIKLSSALRGSAINLDSWHRAIGARIVETYFNGQNLKIRFCTSFDMNKFLALGFAYDVADLCLFDFNVHLIPRIPLEDSVGNIINEIDASFHVANPFFRTIF